MVVIGENRKAKKINPEAGREVLEQIFDPDFAVVEIFAGVGIIAEEPACTCGTADGVNDLDLGRINLVAAIGT